MAIRNCRLPSKLKNVILAAPDVDVDVFRSQIADMGKPHPQFTLFVSRDDRALAVSRRVWGNVTRLGSIDPEQEPYKSELAAYTISVIDLTKVKAGDKLHPAKFAESPEIVQLIGSRLSTWQALADNRPGLGDQIVAATASAAAVGGTAAGLAIAAPVAVADQNTRENYPARSDRWASRIRKGRCQRLSCEGASDNSQFRPLARQTVNRQGQAIDLDLKGATVPWMEHESDQNLPAEAAIGVLGRDVCMCMAGDGRQRFPGSAGPAPERPGE